MSRSWIVKNLALASLSLGMLGLSACENAQGLTASEDWVKIGVTPSPTPTASPLPTPAPTNTTELYKGPADVAKYVQKFIDDAKTQGVDVLSDMQNPKLEIQIKSLDAYGASVIGLCETGGGLRRVTFDPDFWNSVSETQRELLAHHELGHCVLYRGHKTSTLASGAYASIMYPVIMSSSTYLSNYDYYQEELFTQSASGVDPQMTVQHICNLDEIGG